MNVTSAIQTQYIPTTSKTKTDQEIHNPFKGQDYVLKTLDDEGNELLNNILSDKTDEEKWMFKLSLDMSLSTEVKNGTVVNSTDIDNSKDASIDRLSAFIEERKRINAPDMLGTAGVAEKLLEAYKNNSSFTNIQDREGSVLDDFIEQISSTNETLSFKSSVLQGEINSKVEEKAMELFYTKAESKESIVDINNELAKYKQELLEEYKQSLKAKDDPNNEKEALIKVLLEDTDKKISALERFLTKNIDKEEKVEQPYNIDEHKIKTLDNTGNEALNGLLSGMSDEKKIFAKLVLDFRLSIKEVKFEDGKLNLTYEQNTDPEAIKEKLDRLIYEKEISPDSGLIGKQEWLRILNGLKDAYSSV